jgi:hypothetical protein
VYYGGTNQTCICACRVVYVTPTSNYDFRVEGLDRVAEWRRLNAKVSVLIAAARQPPMRRSQRPIGRSELAALARSNC